MDKNKIHGFMDQLNLFFIGAVIGVILKNIRVELHQP